MAWLKKIFRKKDKGDTDNIPKSFNPLYQFGFDDIIKETSEEVSSELVACTVSNTLYFQGGAKTDLVSFIFIGKNGCESFPIFRDRLQESGFSSLVIANSNLLNSINSKASHVEIPTLSATDNTYKRGQEWLSKHDTQLTTQLNKTISNASLVLIITENNGFSFAIVDELYKKIHDLNKQPLLVLPIAPKMTVPNEEIITLAFIKKLMDEESDSALPFILFDYQLLLQANSNEDYAELQEKMNFRSANILSDLVLAFNTPSEFYETKFYDVKYALNKIKGPCALFSYDIYDDSEAVSHVLNYEQIGHSFYPVQNTTRGFIVIQSPNEGLKTKEYRKFRTKYSNLDVHISIPNTRGFGTIIRGLLSYTSIPKSILERYKIINNYLIDIKDSAGEIVETVSIKDLDKLFELERYEIRKRPEK